MAVDHTRRLSKSWVLGDFLVDETFPLFAEKLEPDDKAITNLTRLAEALEPVVERFPGPWRVLSGFRDERLNDACRSAGLPASVDSLHLYGCAADIRLEGREHELEAVFEWIGEATRRDLAIHEAVYYPMKGFIHVAIEDPRRPSAKRMLMRT